MNEIIYTKEKIREIVNAVLGKTFGELNNYQLKGELYDKGSYGHILEEDVFEYNKNTNSAPDFKEAGIELKVTPYRINRDGSLSAKERLVLNIINYMDEYKYDFYESHFWYKNRVIQILWYLFEENKDRSEFKITNELLYTIPDNDLPIIMDDWYNIIEKIKQGKAHEISEADTMYLGACTKGANSDSLRQQPFSDILAKQRAFCFKTSYMTQLIRNNFGEKKSAKIIEDRTADSFEAIIEKKLSQYYGMSVNQISNMFGVKSQAKSLNEIILAKMLGVTGKISQTDEFLKANIVPKTIRVNESGTIKESMSFPTFKFEELYNEEWETSSLYELFTTTKFMFVIFEEKNKEFIFKKIKFWNMPIQVLNSSVYEVWKKTKDVISSGNIVKSIVDGVRKTNFPGMAENPVCHVRPHGRDASDTYPLPVADNYTGLYEYTKHCFWLNSSFVLKIINN